MDATKLAALVSKLSSLRRSLERADGSAARQAAQIKVDAHLAAMRQAGLSYDSVVGWHN